MKNPILGKWHKGLRAKSCDAQLHIVDGEYFIKLADTTHKVLLEDADISSRLGNLERKFTFKNLGVFITTDNDAIDLLLKNRLQQNNHLHQIELSKKWVLTAIFAIVLFVFSMFKWGIPFVSERIAYIIPDDVIQIISKDALGFLDKHLLETTTLSTEKRQNIRQHFEQSLNKEKLYTLHFRSWNVKDDPVANAFALPSGDIVVTDELIRLAKNQDEIDAILLHEIAHVIYRHGLKSVIRTTFIATVVAIILGDTTAVADVGIGLGSVLTNMNYARKHENEADLFAFRKMLIFGIDPQSFADIMKRITNEKTTVNDKKRWTDYFSSHPNTSERNKIAKKYSNCFKKNILCD